MRKIPTLIRLFLICSLFFSCEKETIDDDVREVLQEETTVFDQGQFPSGLKSVMEESELVLFGETHYVQQHQEFIVRSLPELSERGYRLIFDEMFHCFSWMVQDYIEGDREELPDFILFFHEEIIEGVKAFNRTAPDSLKFQLVYMDLNHWPSNFHTCIDEIEKILGPQPVFVPIKDLPADSDAYFEALATIERRLAAEQDQFVLNWGQKWHDRISGIVSVERESARFRKERSDKHREGIMFDNITIVLEANPGRKALINTGMFHAQKETFMGNSIPRLGQLLENFNAKTASVAFIGMTGETRFQFNDKNNVSFHLAEKASDRNIIGVIHHIARERSSFLPLENNIFSDRAQVISFTTSTLVEAPLGRQFDAIVTYPEISVLESMGRYDWR